MINDLQKALSAPFPASDISWRVGATNADKSKGIALAYLDARDVMRRLDEACGFTNWQCRYPLANSGLLICELGLFIDGEWLWRANGAGDTHVEAEKGKCSDAFKRSAVLWGIGRYLYDLPAPWCELQGGKYLSKGTQADLTKRLDAWQSKYFKEKV